MDLEYRDHKSLILHILSSIRTIDARIDELTIVVRDKCVKKAAANRIKERIVKLLESRMNLCYSLFDICGSLKDYKMNYESIKRHGLFK